MQPRLDAQKASPAALHAMLTLESFVAKSSKLERSLIELVKMRASQINGCAFCIDMHSKDARAGRGDRTTPLCPERVAQDSVLYRT